MCTSDFIIVVRLDAEIAEANVGKRENVFAMPAKRPTQTSEAWVETVS